MSTKDPEIIQFIKVFFAIVLFVVYFLCKDSQFDSQLEKYTFLSLFGSFYPPKHS